MIAVRLVLAAAVTVAATWAAAAPAQANPLECSWDNPTVCYVECLAAKNVSDIKRGDLNCPLQ